MKKTIKWFEALPKDAKIVYKRKQIKISRGMY